MAEMRRQEQARDADPLKLKVRLGGRRLWGGGSCTRDGQQPPVRHPIPDATGSWSCVRAAVASLLSQLHMG